MSLTVTTQAADLRLTTVEALKADLGDATSTNDSLYDAMILRASAGAWLISLMPPALSVIGPNESSEIMIPASDNIDITAIAIP